MIDRQLIKCKSCNTVKRQDRFFNRRGDYQDETCIDCSKFKALSSSSNTFSESKSNKFKFAWDLLVKIGCRGCGENNPSLLFAIDMRRYLMKDIKLNMPNLIVDSNYDNYDIELEIKSRLILCPNCIAKLNRTDESSLMSEANSILDSVVK